MNRYQLAYEFIPFLIEQLSGNQIHFGHLVQNNTYQLLLGQEKNDFDLNDFQVSMKILSESVTVFAYVFPEPISSPEAKFGVIFVNSNNSSINYYTLEKSRMIQDGNQIYMIGKILKIGNRVNYGVYEDNLSIDSFVSYIYNHFENFDTEIFK